MDSKIAGKWVAALRSGDYVQAKGTLRGPANEAPGAVGHCCLGVLCELHREFIESQVGPGHAEWVPTADKSVGVPRIMGYRSGSYQAEGVLPGPVREWAGLESINPSAGGNYLTELNDGCHSFGQIASFIEANVERL
jgi:hypothetical protein